MIKNSVLVYAPSGTGKTTYLQRVWQRDHHQALAINLNRSYAPILHEIPGFRTRQYLVTPDRKTPALSLSSSPAKWPVEIVNYQKRCPVIRHILFDEVQCIIPVYLTHIIQLIRAIYRQPVPVIMCGLMSGVINGKRIRFPQMKGLMNITEKVIRYHRPKK